MLIFTEKKLREIIREEVRDFAEKSGMVDNLDLLNYETGSEVIFPNFIRERFDTGQVNSMRDIL